MELFLTTEDRQALMERAQEDTKGHGWVDYFGMLVEVALMYPQDLEEIKARRDNPQAPQYEEPERTEHIERAALKPTHLRIVK